MRDASRRFPDKTFSMVRLEGDAVEFDMRDYDPAIVLFNGFYAPSAKLPHGSRHMPNDLADRRAPRFTKPEHDSRGDGFLSFSPGLLGKNATVHQCRLFQVCIDHVCQDGFVLSITVPDEILAHSRYQLRLVAANRAIDLLEPNASPTAANVPIVLEVSV